MLIYGLLVFLAEAQMQDCTNLTINMIIPCQMYFTYNSTLNQCLFAYCFTQSPGNPQNSSIWQNCYTLCCPGFVLPNDSTINSVFPCYNQYSSQPLVNFKVQKLVYAIGGIIGAVFFMICICHPCCVDRSCLFYKLRVALLKTQKNKSARKQDRYQEKFKLEREQQINKHQGHKLTQEPQGSHQEYEKQQMKLRSLCSLCAENQPDCRLLCEHFYHNSCLIKANNDSLTCNVCQQKISFPVYCYCRFCFKNFILKYQMSQLAHQYTCITCLL